MIIIQISKRAKAISIAFAFFYLSCEKEDHVLTTVVQIVRDFTTQFPEIKVFFLGSTKERTKLYARILRMYYYDFRKEFIITGRMEGINCHLEGIFDPSFAFEYSAFFLKKIINLLYAHKKEKYQETQQTRKA